jgi:hypothetical protein
LCGLVCSAPALVAEKALRVIGPKGFLSRFFERARSRKLLAIRVIVPTIAVPPATLLFGFPVVARFSDMSTEGFLRLVTYALQRRGFVICSLIIALSAGVGTTLGAESGRKQRLANGDRRASYASWVLAPIMGAALVGHGRPLPGWLSGRSMVQHTKRMDEPTRRASAFARLRTR